MTMQPYTEFHIGYGYTRFKEYDINPFIIGNPAFAIQWASMSEACPWKNGDDSDADFNPEFTEKMERWAYIEVMRS